MASSIIHIAVANKINKSLGKDYHKLILGSIAPDISKLVGMTKEYSHFFTSRKPKDIPDLEKFLFLYKDNLNDDFVLGYYIHLYTDYLWFKYFIPEIWDKKLITKIDGTVYKCSEDMLRQYLYSDYTNLNIGLIDKYDLNMDILYKPLPCINNIIKEIPMDKLNLIVDKTYEILKRAKERKEYLFNIEEVEKFIETSSELILASLNEMNIN